MFNRKLTFLMLMALLITIGCSDDESPTEPPPPGPTSEVLDAVKDNTLYEDVAGAWSNGAGNYVFVGVTNPLGGSGEPAEIRRTVMAFEISTGGIPAGSTIDSVFLTLAVSKTPNLTPTTVTLHRLLADWGEGTSQQAGEEGGGDASDPGDATWIHTFYDTTMWTTPGGDFVGATSASQTVAGLGRYIWGSTSGMVADVQLWLDTPATDFGWIIIGDETTHTTARRFGSRTGDVFDQPELLIYYTAP